MSKERGDKEVVISSSFPSGFISQGVSSCFVAVNCTEQMSSGSSIDVSGIEVSFFPPPWFGIGHYVGKDFLAHSIFFVIAESIKPFFQLFHFRVCLVILSQFFCVPCGSSQLFQLLEIAVQEMRKIVLRFSWIFGLCFWWQIVSNSKHFQCTTPLVSPCLSSSCHPTGCYHRIGSTKVGATNVELSHELVLVKRKKNHYTTRSFFFLVHDSFIILGNSIAR